MCTLYLSASPLIRRDPTIPASTSANRLHHATFAALGISTDSAHSVNIGATSVTKWVTKKVSARLKQAADRVRVHRPSRDVLVHRATAPAA
ncbi:unnamed protein product [Echinostoma caproni]|uniref:HTH_Tnp_ISL3 domain-containing protein n=1 Tax=Echinostoma caproni TaxID=27848 RepID=A0A183A293_9TREM|nr:unnamed protein product [Echinostoma caproni]